MIRNAVILLATLMALSSASLLVLRVCRPSLVCETKNRFNKWGIESINYNIPEGLYVSHVPGRFILIRSRIEYTWFGQSTIKPCGADDTWWHECWGFIISKDCLVTRGDMGVAAATAAILYTPHVRVSLPLVPLLLITAGVPVAAFIQGRVRRRQRRKNKLCVDCGYDLEGNTTGKCPECGKEAGFMGHESA